jgi:hypothetical protein
MGYEGGKLPQTATFEPADQTGRLMATKLVEALGDLCQNVLLMDEIPKIMIQLYTDVTETVEDLQKVASRLPDAETIADQQIGRIENEAAFLRFLSGFNSGDGLVSVNLVEGVYGPGDAISSKSSPQILRQLLIIRICQVLRQHPSMSDDRPWSRMGKLAVHLPS